MALPKDTKGQENLIFGTSHKEFILRAGQVIGIFITTFLILFAFGLTPSTIQRNVGPELTPEDLQATGQTTIQRQVTIGGSGSSNSVAGNTLPTRILINKIGVDSVIQHPPSPNIDVLDAALTKGAVYYPGSGSIEEGNIFLFGHSSNWQVVRNQAYKTFNGLDKLTAGDRITLWGTDGEVYTYSVQQVSLVDEDEALVDFSKTDSTLTLSTCNTFGAKQERWVVNAVLVG